MSLDFDSIFPDDENGAMLRRMAANGETMDQPREFDFFFEFPAELNAETFAREIDDPLAFASSHSMDGRFIVCISKVLVPTHREINDTQTKWTHLAALHHGKPDGWGPG